MQESEQDPLDPPYNFEIGVIKEILYEMDLKTRAKMINESNFSQKILMERKRRLKGDFFPTTLKALCLDSIKTHSSFFLEIHKCTRLNPFNRISNSLKTEVLGNKTINKWSRWEKLLVHKDVDDLKIEELDPKGVDEFFLELLLSFEATEHQVKLKTFELTLEVKSYRTMSQSSIPVLITTSSQIFSDVQSLRLTGFYCKNRHLQLIAANLKKLRVLILQLQYVNASGVLALSTLEHLEKLPVLCATDCRIIHPDRTRVYNLCLRYLPKLLVAGEEELFFPYLEEKLPILDNRFQIDFQSLPTPIELGRQQLLLENKGGAIPDGITFPNLTSLCLWAEGPAEVGFQMSASFSKVTDLALIYLGTNENMRFLSFMGHQIRRLVIIESEELILDGLLRLCPNLEELNIDESPRNVTSFSPLEPRTDLKKLYGIRLNCFTRPVEFSPGLLVQLLSAPKIQWLKFDRIAMCKADAEAIVELVQQGKILQELEQFDVNIKRITANAHLNKEFEARYELMLDNMAKFCPRLVSINHMSNDEI